jgi:glycosyltransferase involved in cell wall biosynthesis
MQWVYGIGEITQYAKNNNLSVGMVHISQWERSMNNGMLNHLLSNGLNAKEIIIPNPIFDEIINEVKSLNIQKIKGKFIFHASWPRGGDVAYDAFKQLNIPNKQFHAFDYLMVIHDYREGYFHKHQGVDKKTLFTHLAESEYFVYPLYTPYKDVHKDTFSCVVAEALSLGVIVITYPLGALPENFNDLCVWLPPPNGADFDKMQQESLSKDEDGIFKTTTSIVETINVIERNPTMKNLYQNKGKDVIVDSFNINKVGQMWVDFISQL